METSATLWPCEELNLLTSRKGRDGIEEAYTMLLGVVAEVQDTRDWMLCVLLRSSVHMERGRKKPTEGFLGASSPLNSRCPTRIAPDPTPLPQSKQTKVCVLGLMDKAHVTVPSQVSLQSI